MKRILTTLVILAFGICRSANATPISGTKSIGPTGDYTSITAAIADIQTQSLSGALVLELQAAYVSNVETFPLTIPTLNGASATNTVTIRPQAGATGLSISSANTTAATVDLNGAQFVTIDGRPGGVGSNAGSGSGAASQLTIANTSTAGVALRFINEASSNTIRYTTLRGVNTAASGGTIFFSNTTGANGNDDNTIDHCDIGDGASAPTNGLVSIGTTSTVQNNSGNTVSNCNIFNFYSSTTNATGVSLSTGNTNWSITGNSFYQTVSRVASSAQVFPILITSVINNYGNNFVVTGNFIGGSAPNASGAAWTTTGTSASYRFVGINLIVGTATPSSVQENVIRNIAWTSSSATNGLSGGVWSGILVQTGSANIGTVVGNTIGSDTGTNSVSVTTSGNGGTTLGISSSSSGTVVIANNTVGSISTNGADTSGNPSTAVSTSLIGIQVSAGVNTISNNTVGSTATPSPLTSNLNNLNSLNAATSSTSTTGQQVTGILSSSGTSASITGNTVANLNNNATSNPGQVHGIVTSAGVNTITGNTVRNLSTTSLNTNSTNSQSVFGILQTSTREGQTLSENTVHSIANMTTVTGPGSVAAVSVTGIYFAGPTSGTNVIARNLVHSLALPFAGSSSRMVGIYFSDGRFTVANNMVRMGLHADSSSTAGSSSVYGILDSGVTAGRNFHHNSVYVGGTQTFFSNNTYAFLSGGSDNARAFQNNIFVNARSNVGGTGKHCAVAYSTTSLSNLIAGGNIFLASGTGGVLGRYNSADFTTLSAWQAATGQDVSSATVDPLFVNPNGDATSVDLHLQANNPAEGGGIPLIDALTAVPATLTDDFDGQTRSTFTPMDIGADAGNFTSPSGDIFAPAISYPPLTRGSTANRVLTAWASIADNVGVSGGANSPRLYFKKTTDADAFSVPNDSTGNGWKYVAASNSTSPFSFTIDYTLINGGSVTIGDTIQYFVVAQDGGNNFGSNPAAATASANPPMQNVDGHGMVNIYSIVPTISGTKTVGSGGDYPNLSGAGGLFAALNGSVLTGTLVINIISDVTENGSVSLNECITNEYPVGNSDTLTIQPGSAAMRTLSGTSRAGLITLNGADRVTIDGRFAGTGRYLTFRNTHNTFPGAACTILFTNDASNNTVRNCIIEGAGMTSPPIGVITFSTGSVTGNDNNLITDCQVRDLSTGVGVPTSLIGSTGSSTTVANSGNTISNNDLFNFTNIAIYVGQTGNDSWTLSGNEIHAVNTSYAGGSATGIDMEGGGGNLITDNFIHDLPSPLSSATSIGIQFLGTGTTTLARNRITIFNLNEVPASVRGIYAQGGTGSTLNVVNNQITLRPSTSISTTLYGFLDISSFGSVVNVFCNSFVLGGTEIGTRSSWASLRNRASLYTARNNIFLNLRNGGTGSHFAAGSEVTGGSYIASNNVYAGTGTTAANFMDFSGTSGTSTPVSFASWQSSIGDTNSQDGIAGTGSFNAAMFVNAANGDLHLVPGGTALVNSTGIPIAGVTDDFDGDPRPASAPSIGSDQIPFADIAVTQTVTLTDNASSVDLGEVNVGGSSAALTFTITNPGTADLTSLAVSADGANAADFTVSALSSTSVSVGSGSVTFTVTFSPSAGGARNAAIHIASNVSGAKNPFDIALTGNGLVTQSAWRQMWFGTTANSGDAADTFDFDRDGLVNVLERAFGLNPTQNSAGQIPAGQIIGGNFVISFTQPDDVTGITYGAEWSHTLTGTWNPITDTGSAPQHTFSVPVSSGTNVFVRLKVTAVP